MTVEKLQNDTSFQLLLMLRHDEILGFVQDEFSSRTWSMRLYILLNFLLLAVIVVFAVLDIRNALIGWDKLLGYFSLGILLVFTLLIPLHEGIHGLAYKLVGAPRVSYGVNWKKFYFYAVADKFVIDRNSFIFIALAPFFVITLLIVAIFFMAFVEMKWVLWGVLFMHTAACAGDFAMVSFYEKYRECEEMVTFDDVKENISFFYVKE